MAFSPQNFLVQAKEVNSGGVEQEIWKEKMITVSIVICKFGDPAEKAFCKKGSEGGQCVCLGEASPTLPQNTRNSRGERATAIIRADHCHGVIFCRSV